MSAICWQHGGFEYSHDRVDALFAHSFILKLLLEYLEQLSEKETCLDLIQIKQSRWFGSNVNLAETFDCKREESLLEMRAMGHNLATEFEIHHL